MRKFDPYLPCRSHHVPNRRRNDEQRPTADASTATSSNRSTNTMTPTVSVQSNVLQNELPTMLHDLFDQFSRSYNNLSGARNPANGAANNDRTPAASDYVQVTQPPEPCIRPYRHLDPYFVNLVCTFVYRPETCKE